MKRRSFLAGLGAAPFLRNMEINLEPEPAIEADEEPLSTPTPEISASPSLSPSDGPDGYDDRNVPTDCVNFCERCDEWRMMDWLPGPRKDCCTTCGELWFIERNRRNGRS